jgi:hypothetical protein
MSNSDTTAQELQDKMYEVLSYLHQQKHLKKGCFCTTEIAGPFKLMWDLFDTYASQREGAAVDSFLNTMDKIEEAWHKYHGNLSKRDFGHKYINGLIKESEAQS